MEEEIGYRCRGGRGNRQGGGRFFLFRNRMILFISISIMMISIRSIDCIELRQVQRHLRKKNGSLEIKGSEERGQKEEEKDTGGGGGGGGEIRLKERMERLKLKLDHLKDLYDMVQNRNGMLNDFVDDIVTQTIKHKLSSVESQTRQTLDQNLAKTAENTLLSLEKRIEFPEDLNDNNDNSTSTSSEEELETFQSDSETTKTFSIEEDT